MKTIHLSKVRKPFILTAFSALALLFTLTLSCNKEMKKKIVVNPEFGTYISAYTAGVISNDSRIVIKLTNDYEETVNYAQPVDKELFTFEPAIKGKVYFTDQRTIEFMPDELLPPNTEYTAHFHLSELMEVPEEYQSFDFEFKTRKIRFNVQVDGLSTYETNNLKRQKLEGELHVSDNVDTAKIAKCVYAFQEGSDLKMEWHHSEESHRFVVHNISRKDKASHVKISWNGIPVGSADFGEQEMEVPALGDFKITKMESFSDPEQFVEIYFSDPVMTNQSFTGLVTIADASSLSFAVEGHKLIVYPSSRLAGYKTVSVYKGIKNILGYPCPDEEVTDMDFEELKPSVRLLGEGVIIPTSERGMLFPFEAVNLKAVDVYVTRIYENNILQFLQVNNMDGTNQLRRVGKNILKKRIELDPEGKLNLHDWNNFSIDLGTIVRVEPGAIYNVELRYNRKYSVYSCGDDPGEEENNQMAEIRNPVEEKPWNEDGWGYIYDDYYSEDYYDDNYYYDYDYDYNERENPCHDTYYYDKTVQRNVLVSDIGLIAKAGDDKMLNIFVNDIRTTQPISGCAIEIYDFTQQKMATVTTNGDGFASAKLPEKPYVMIAKNGSQRGYLRMRDGEALSMSKFAVDGESVQRGVKGFIYTERGVWRPGDSIYVSFMLEDKEGILPAGHPVAMELVNPRGVVTQKVVKTANVNGLYDFRTATLPQDPTGYWTTNIHVGNRQFSKTLRVETVKPNRLKIYVDFKKQLLKKDDTDNTVKLNSKWLHGAPAKELAAKVEVTVNQVPTVFKGYKDYIFDDPTRTFSAEEQVVFDDYLDENGDASFDASLEIGDAAPGMLRAHFVTRVFEEGGDFSIDRSSVMYSPFKSYVGIKVPEGDQYNGTLVTDKDHIIQVATVDPDGKPLSRRNLTVKVYNIQWRWWWDNYDEDLSSYIANNGITPVLDTKINTTNGKGNFVLRVNRPSWGRYLVMVKDNESGHATGQVVYIDWPSWARANRKDNENASMLSFATDKESYKTGEMVKVSFPSSGGGKALVSIESGIKMINYFWVDTQNGETKFEFPATSEMTPNVFVNISLLQPHIATANDLPLRLYGVLPISVEDPGSHLEPTIAMPDILRPESKTNIVVREKTGKPMTYTLAIVDEGLLDLTSFKTPDPWDHFNAKEALGVKTWDMYDLVMGSFASKMDKLLAIGGDGEGNGKKNSKANRFKPMVHFAGPFKIPAFGMKSHTVEIPNYVGSVRVMVVAGEDVKYGHAEKTVPVRNPLMVLGTLPRVLGPGETVHLPVDVFAMEPHVKDVTVEIIPNEFFKPKDGTKKSLKFAKIGDEVINFELAVAEKTGVGKIQIIAKSGKEVAKYDVEIDVRAPNPKVTDVAEAVIEPGKKWDPAFNFNGVAGTNKVTIEVSSIPSINLGERLKYLIQYPHGCIEQTTSSAFPQLYLSNVMELDNNFKKEIANNINAAIKRIQLFQTNDGGFAYWPGEGEDNEWGSNYAGHFLLEAEAKGYKVPNSLKSNWIKYQTKMARDWRNSGDSHGNYDDHTQAYRLYTLALAKAPELGAMNRLRESGDLTTAGKWRLAAAYQLTGQNTVAVKVISGTATSVDKYRELSYTYGSEVRDEAMILEALVLMKDKVKATPVMMKIAKQLNSNHWMSTQETAYCLMAIGKYIGNSPVDKTMKFSYSVNGATAVNKSTQKTVYQQKLAVSEVNKKGKLNFNNTGAGTLYVKLVTEGVPVTGDQSSASSNVKLEVNYVSMSGKKLDVSKLEQGTDFIAEVTLTNTGTRGYLTEMALNQIFPSGWEIHNTRMDEFSSSMQSDYPRYQDFRDDRVYTYYDLENGKSKTFRFKINAAYLGKFYLPTVSTEAMYDNTINARVPGRWVEIVKPGTGPLTQR